MDGEADAPRIGLVALCGAFALATGCGSIQPEPAPVPFSLFDSPLIAGGNSTPDVSESEARAETDEAVAEDASTEEESEGRTDADPPDDGAEPPPALANNRADSRRSSDDSEAITGAAAAHDAAAAPTSNPSADRDDSYNANAARYVAAIYELNGVDLPPATRGDIPAMYRHCRENAETFQSRAPAAGDLAFFHNVADANDDGRANDWYTHVALVEDVDDSDTVQFLGYRNGSVQSFSMNLDDPDQAERNGETINSKLRPERDSDPPYTQYLAGQLFAGYCALLGDKSELLVVDNWEPGMELEKP